MSRLAALVYPPSCDLDALLALFAEEARGRGWRVAGLVQVNRPPGPDDLCDSGDMALRDLARERSLSICLDLGPGSTGCRLDSGAMATAAGWLREGMEGPVDLVIVNKFGRLECEGEGLLAEIGEAVARDLPLIVGVPERFLGAWDTFCGGLDAKLDPTLEALRAWAQALERAPAPTLS